ncbi:MAG TPA: hypothetical protein VJP77_04175 [Planctomycetota bacterium]|nr:hypothetical protein [Planctomycetota bacterium]
MQHYLTSPITVSGLVAVAILVTGAVSATRSPQLATAVNLTTLVGAGPLTVGGIPGPNQMHTIGAGETYVVPPGARYVVTGVGAVDQFVSLAQIRFDDVPVLAPILFDGAERRATASIPAGLVAQPGTSIRAALDTVVIFGYLARLGEDPDLVLDGVPLPSQMLRIHEDETFVVPLGKRLVFTGAGTSWGETTARIMIDGHESLEIRVDNTTGHVQSLPPGLTASAGAQVQLLGDGSSDWGVLFGYLRDE